MTITQSVSPIKLDRSLSTGPSYSLSSLQISDSSGGLGPSDHPSSSNDSIEVSNHSNLDQLKTTEGAEEGLASATSLPSCPPLPELDLLLEQLLNNCGLVSDASARQRILINMSKDRKWHTVKMLKKMQTGPSSSFLHKSSISSTSLKELVHFIDSLKAAKISSLSVDLFRSMRVQLRHEPASHLDEFVKRGGFEAMFGVLKTIYSKTCKSLKHWVIHLEILKTVQIIFLDKSQGCRMLLEHPSILFALSELCFSHHYNTQWKNLKQSLDVIPSIYLSSNHTPPLANRIFLTNFLIDLLKFSRMDIWTVVLKSLDETNWPLQKGCSSTNDGVAKQVRADSGIEMMTVSSSHTAKEVVAVAGGDKLKQPNSRLFSSKFGRMSSNPVSNISKSWRRQSNPPNLQQREDKEKETAKEETIAEPMYITSLSPSVYSNTLFRAWLIEFEACALERFKEWSGHTRKSREVFNFLANGTYIWQKIVPAISSLMGDEIVCGDMAIEYLLSNMYLVNSIIEQTIPSTVESRAAVRELLKKHRLLEIIEKIKVAPNADIAAVVQTWEAVMRNDEKSGGRSSSDPSEGSSSS